MIIYDLEIVKAIPVKKEPQIEGIEYCKDWGDYAGMGISCLCAYDYETDRYRVFTESNRDEFSKLLTDRLFIGFNNIGFDNKVVNAVWNIEIPKGKCYDILRKIQNATGIMVSLDACCKANFGTEKTRWGGSAPVDWQQGKIGTVIDYCLEDVRLTKMLFDQICGYGSIVDPKNITRKLKIERP